MRISNICVTIILCFCN